ncbi:hypothetical protein M1E08_15980 [Erwinia sp. PK3-005]
MSLSLPDTSLYYLPRDNLDPEKFELIISPSLAWSHIDSEYVFDDRWSSGYQLINMRKRDFNGYTHQQPPQGPHERSKLKRMVYSGEVVMLSSAYFSAGGLFYIDGNGDLVCRSPLSFQYGGAQDVIREYKRSVARRDYSNRSGKPRPTVLPAQLTAVTQPTPLSTINSKAAGQLLAAGGIYHGNPEDFKKTAEQLGGDAPAGYDQMSSDQIKGLLIAGASIAAGLTLGRINIGAGKSAIEAADLEVTSNRAAGLIPSDKKYLITQAIPNSVINPNKFNYLFGKASGNSHILDRTNQLALEMNRLGVTNDLNGHSILAEHFTNITKEPGNILKKYSDKYGNFELRESFFMGPSGKATTFESTFEVMSDGTRRFITTIPKNGGAK